MKLLYVIDKDTPMQICDLDTSKYKEKYYDALKTKYDCDVEFVVDDALIVDGEYEKGNLKIEKEGPEWAINNEATMKAAEDADIICVSFGAVGKRLIDAAKKCKVVVVMRSGVENVNLEYCKEKGIKVINAPGRVSDPVADMTVAMMLAVIREIQRLDLHHIEFAHAREIRVQPKDKPLISDMTIGFVGFGIIGAKVAKRLSGFSPNKLIAYDPYCKKEVADAYGVELKSLEEVMSTSDLVTVHARLTPETKGLVGAKEFAMMKPTAYFVNTARAGLIDEAALIDALSNHKIRAAALDVFNAEPLPVDSPFCKLDNVVLTPHMSGGAGDSISITQGIIYEDIFRFLNGEELKNVRNR